MASKRAIYLSKNKTSDNLRNVFVFDENGPRVNAKWVLKNIELNNGDGCLVVLDHDYIIHDTVQEALEKKSYCIERMSASGIPINPFDLIHNSSESHHLFLNLLYTMWDNNDRDINTMSNLIDAFASCVSDMFKGQPQRLNMKAMKKLVKGIKATCTTAEGEVPMLDAIFGQIKDQNSMPCKYYAQFKKAAGERYDEICGKVYDWFNLFSKEELNMMNQTDETLETSLKFKTALFINVSEPEEERRARVMITLLNYFIQNMKEHNPITFVLDSLNVQYKMENLPHWMGESEQYDLNYLVMCDNIADFNSTERNQRFFKNLRNNVDAFVLVHVANDKKRKKNAEINEDDQPLIPEKVITTVWIQKENFREQDLLF